MKGFLSLLWLSCVLLVFPSCEKTENGQETEMTTSSPEAPVDARFRVSGPNILDGQNVRTFRGVNALQTFGLDDSDDLQQWGVEIVREFIGNLREQPIAGSAIQASNGVWYHPLQAIVDQHRAAGRITMLCPFGWVNNNGERQLLTGLNPREQSFYPAYKAKMQALAEHFKDQPDVWIEVWNEPYSWQNANGYTDERWVLDMRDMVDNLRSVEGFTNIIIVPGAEQGQSERVIIEHANELQADNYNIVYDLHAYEKWLINVSEQEVFDRMQALTDAGLPVLFGEIGVENATGLMDVLPFLSAAKRADASVLAWIWKKDGADVNAIRNDEGQPNDQSNGGWGSAYRAYLSR